MPAVELDNVDLRMSEQQPDQFLAGVTAGTDDGNFGFVHVVKNTPHDSGHTIRLL